MQFLRVERASSKISKEKNAYIFVFEFTNFSDEPKSTHSDFWIDFYQNNTQIGYGLSDSYSDSNEKQSELLHSAYNKALKNGTIPFALFVVAKDSSPITVEIRRNGGSGDESTLFEVNLD